MAAPGQTKVELSNANSVRSRRSSQREFTEVIHSLYNDKILIVLKARTSSDSTGSSHGTLPSVCSVCSPQFVTTSWKSSPIPLAR